jgi:DNA-binding IclR family transcriptional regulator
MPLPRNSQTFLMERGGVKIEVPELLKFETSRHHSLSNKITSRLLEIKREYHELVELQRWNNYVETFEIRAQIRLNQTYHLYESSTGRKFLSIIPPEEFPTQNHLGKTKLHSEGYFVKEI